MNVLWPDDLFASARELPALKLLEEQADALQSISDGRLRGEVTTSVVSGVVIAAFSAVAVDNDSHRFEILRVRSPAGSWPCVIENYHLESLRLQTVKSELEFADAIAGVLRHPRTAEILRVLWSEHGGSEKATRGPVDILPQKFDADGRKLVKFRLHGMSSFLDASTVLALLGNPDEETSNFKALGNGRYIMHVELASPLAVALTRAEVESLQTSIRSALTGWYSDPSLPD